MVTLQGSSMTGIMWRRRSGRGWCALCAAQSSPTRMRGASCGNVDELRSYSSERGRDPEPDPSRGAKCVGGVSMRMKDQGEDRIDE